MRVYTSKLTVDCPHCKKRGIIQGANGLTSVECSSCHQSIELPKLVGNVIADQVIVLDPTGKIDTLNLEDL